MTAHHRRLKPLRLFVVAIVLICAFFGGLAGLALASAERPQPSLDVPLQEESGAGDEAETCGSCHAEVVEVWSGGPHDLAYDIEHFQTSWEEQDFDPLCLDCHTTGFSPATGEYLTQGVSCVACHGPIPGDHPATPVDVGIANTACENCHSVTHAEFRASMHEAAGLTCTSCHYAHSNGLRLEDEVTQCTSCHSHQLDDFAHASHVNAGLTCRQCHGYVQPGQEIPPTGLAPTGHDFQERMTACLDCHEDIQLTLLDGGQEHAGGFSSAQAEASFAGGEKAALRISQLEATVDTLILQNRNRAAIGLMQGGIVGLVVGGLGVWLVTRRRRGFRTLNGGDNDES